MSVTTMIAFATVTSAFSVYNSKGPCQNRLNTQNWFKSSSEITKIMAPMWNLSNS